MGDPGGADPLWLVQFVAGERRDLSVGFREQPGWDEHAAFIDALVAEGCILLGGPLEGSAARCW